MAAICTFRDKEVVAGQWSGPLPKTKLLPGGKISPMFVVWQHNKARVITNHTASGLNDYIPCKDAHVQYDNMQSFGQTLYEALTLNEDEVLKTDKSIMAQEAGFF